MIFSIEGVLYQQYFYFLGFYVAKEGTPTSDVECECDLEKGYHLYVDGMCFQDMCPSGEQLTVTGNVHLEKSYSFY